MPITFPLSVPTPRYPVRLGCVATGNCGQLAVATGATNVNGGNFDRLMKQAQALQGDGRGQQDAAIAAYFQALQASTTYDQAVAAVVAMPDRYSYADATRAAMGEVIKRATSRDQALSAAELAWTRGRGFDRWALGALDKALSLSTTPGQCQEIARLAQSHEHLDRYAGLVQRALAKAGN